MTGTGSATAFGMIASGGRDIGSNIKSTYSAYKDASSAYKKSSNTSGGEK
jgi:hypothetical protein